jgi:hypothetical protein
MTTWFPSMDTAGNRHPLGIGTVVQDDGLIVALSVTLEQAEAEFPGVTSADHDLALTIDIDEYDDEEEQYIEEDMRRGDR